MPSLPACLSQVGGLEDWGQGLAGWECCSLAACIAQPQLGAPRCGTAAWAAGGPWPLTRWARCAAGVQREGPAQADGGRQALSERPGRCGRPGHPAGKPCLGFRFQESVVGCTCAGAPAQGRQPLAQVCAAQSARLHAGGAAADAPCQQPLVQGVGHPGHVCARRRCCSERACACRRCCCRCVMPSASRAGSGLLRARVCVQAVLQQGRKLARQSPDCKADLAAFEARLAELAEEASAQVRPATARPAWSGRAPAWGGQQLD